MTYTLSNLLQDVYLELGQTSQAVLTEGSTTTAVASTLKTRLEDHDGHVIVTETTDGAAPQGEWGHVTAFDQNTGTFTLLSVLSAALGAGDRIAFVPYGNYPLDVLIELANSGLRRLGPLTVSDVSVSTESDKTEYTLPAAVKYNRVREVLIQTNTDDSDDNRYQPIHGWRVKPTTTGTVWTLILQKQPTASRTLLILYDIPGHARVSAYDDQIHEVIPPELAVAAVVEKALKWQIGRLGPQEVDKIIMGLYKQAQENLKTMKATYPIWHPRRKSRILIIEN
jgi:hypothetical protein